MPLRLNAFLVRCLRVSLVVYVIVESIKNEVLSHSLSENIIEAMQQNVTKKFQGENVFVKLQTKQIKNNYEITNKIAINYIWPTFPIAFLIIGTIGNILSIIIVIFLFLLFFKKVFQKTELRSGISGNSGRIFFILLKNIPSRKFSAKTNKRIY